MCDIASHHLDKWSASRLAKALIATSETPLSAEGKKQMPKAFCAGGDIARQFDSSSLPPFTTLFSPRCLSSRKGIHMMMTVIARQSVDPKTRGEAMAFFKKEYELDWKLACFSVGQQAHDGSKSYIALMDGITFGGGAGLAFPAAIRVATENTRFGEPFLLSFPLFAATSPTDICITRK
jgi:enoyl-CoA hydratase/carnithine racemase